MSEPLHPGMHPDADSLNAFIEGVLPEHERLACLAHLADCPRCREIVYLAQEPAAPASIPADPVPFWKGWFGPIPVLAAALVCMLLVSIGVYRLIQPKRVEPVLTAVATPPIEPSAALSEPVKEPPSPRPAKSIATRRPAIVQDTAPAASPVVTAPQAVPVSPAAPPPASPIAGAQFAALPNTAPKIATSGIAGTVTDPAGVVIAGADVTIRPVTGTSNLDTRTDNKGQYTFAGLPPGKYEVQFLSPGFKETKKQIDLQPQLVARADSRLEVGAATDTVTVTNEAPLLKTESGELSHTIATTAGSSLPLLTTGPRPGLASGLRGTPPPPTTASNGKLALKVDRAGTLFFSKDGGKSWKAVKPLWQRRVVRVESAHDPGAVFQLTTDSGSVWLSRDGAHWNPAPTPR
jgi:Carboxypeptidase regulatory-like domain/Putative zinc-finger